MVLDRKFKSVQKPILEYDSLKVLIRDIIQCDMVFTKSF